jgi:hypothetical protein
MRRVIQRNVDVMIVGEVWSHTLVLTADAQDLAAAVTGPAELAHIISNGLPSAS